MANSDETQSGFIGNVGKVAGLLLFVAILLAPSAGADDGGLSASAQRLTAVTALMAVFWITQCIPIAATSLIPLVAFPFLGIQSARDVSQSYMNQSIFLFLGGFIIALGIEKWGLHRRMALHIIRLLGTSLKRVVLGFMLATAFLSMWISNTASTLLMLPIGLAMLTSLRDLSAPVTGQTDRNSADTAVSRLAVVLLLGIAYSASIGGLTTLVGTPTNVQFLQIWNDQFPDAPELSAGEWMMAVVPLGIIFLLIAWRVLVWRLPTLPGAEKFQRSFFTERLRELGAPSRAEIQMLVVFTTTAALWIFRKPFRIGSEPILPGWGDGVEVLLLRMGSDPQLAHSAVHDSTVAIGMALLMFFLPAKRDEKKRTEYLMDWRTAEKLPWGILLLIGGGFALAGAFRETGLSLWLGNWFAEMVSDWSPVMVVAAVCFLMTTMTEVTSNVATVSAVLPVLASASMSTGIDPRLVMIPATISTSCAFMLPIATPPNAIVFGSGQVRMGQMVRYGIVLNLIGVLLITVMTFALLVPQFGISLDGLPDWAKTSP